MLAPQSHPEPAPPGHASEGALEHPAAWKDFEALRGMGPFDDFDWCRSRGRRRLSHELGAVAGAIGEQVLEPRPAACARCRGSSARRCCRRMSVVVKLTIICISFYLI